MRTRPFKIYIGQSAGDVTTTLIVLYNIDSDSSVIEELHRKVRTHRDSYFQELDFQMELRWRTSGLVWMLFQRLLAS